MNPAEVPVAPPPSRVATVRFGYTTRMTLFAVSATYTVALAEALLGVPTTATPLGLWNRAFVPTPFALPWDALVAPPPASVETTFPLTVKKRTMLLPESAM